jgi:DUF1680 family protein
MSFTILIATRLLMSAAQAPDGPAPIEPVTFAVPARLPDRAEILPPSHIRLGGWLGARIDANARNRLLEVDTEPLLAGYRKRPGAHPWIGEHVGKWLHAATLAWAYTGDPKLKAKLDLVAADLIACQEPDGYLGTYLPEQRFGLDRGSDWDVWSHKYNLIGLLTYYQYTGHQASLAACRKMADLLIATFPGKKSILAAGTHVGMAATSVLEPIVLLYRFTGEPRYLKFAYYIVKSWDEPGGPAILASLRAGKGVNRTANGKAYEMLSNLVGVCELARATGERGLLDPVQAAWKDIVTNRLYLTGSASAGEHFQDDHVLPGQVGAHIGETCVTTTWIQLNLQLLRLTGESKYGEELVRSLYNHLAAAQHPRGDDWCYYTALEGKKPYDSGINCCHSSGPRGMALAVQAAYLRGNSDLGPDSLIVDTLETSRAELDLGGGRVTVSQESKFPRSGESLLTLHMARPATFGLLVRVPKWAKVPPLVSEFKITINDGPSFSAGTSSGYAAVAPRGQLREWKDGDRIKLTYRLAARLVLGHFGDTGRAALAWGPFILAYDASMNPGLPSASTLGLLSDNPPFSLEPGPGLKFRARVVGRKTDDPKSAVFVPFADAGASGGAYRVWLRAPGIEPAKDLSLLAGGEEGRSRLGNQNGSIVDGDPGSFVVTYDGSPAREDWYAVTLPDPARIGRVVFAHGRNFHDGGWFIASNGKPRVQVQRTKGGRWETVGELASYPATTATDPAGIQRGQSFELRLDRPVSAVAVRVIGTPSRGDNSNQAFSSCGELQAFAE